MSRSPVEQTGESAMAAAGGGGGEAQRTTPTPFLTKTYQLVDDPSCNELVSWNEEGTGFIVWRHAEFARDLLPKYFKHNNFSSFVRQLNTYGFRKVATDRWEFCHDYFRRGNKGLLREIQRRRTTPPGVSAPVVSPTVAMPVPLTTVSPANSGDDQVISSTSSPAAAAASLRLATCTSMSELVEENDRLRRENAQLSQELSRLRGLCSSVVNMMSRFASIQNNNNGGQEMQEVVEGTMAENGEGGCNRTTLLFGVPIGSKRARRSDDGEVHSQGWEDGQGSDQVHARGFSVTSVPSVDRMDQDNDGPWLDKL